ncbi:hypothetical protein HF1_08240 [Mycoplasma haemofelis str. Langford 1]|uniref:Uncharacterized protein n=2 Tax=Mycoplasma haemofelis TaxID=29501 RepID=F6FIW3_MYCHI|nr:hypothetical protein [Mycoplasma haemofelis]AEG73161.1 hypothetical protein MHF_0903 [Mycoplasma haemofelis Ohio2]CBY92832.1 hypothetical protein HF1_08240 [Mycoplasma haemofelis str. Langford 1]
MSKLAAASMAGLGAAGASGFGAYHLYSQKPKHEIKTIQDKLVSEGFKILQKSEQSHWTTLKGEYNKIKTDTNKAFATTNTDINEDGLKALCEEFLKKEKEDSSYSKAKRWCVVPVSVTHHLTNLGFTALNTEGAGSQTTWEGLVSEYEDSKNSSHKISGLDTLADTKWEKIRDKCKEIMAKQNYDDSFDTNLESSKRWCVSKTLGVGS